MSNEDQMPEADFDTQLRGLFQEAEQHLEVAKSRRGEESRDAETARFGQVAHLLRPVATGVDALTRLAAENASVLQRIDRQTATILGPTNAGLPALIERLENLAEQRTGVSQKMFDALHEELKGYKDGFLLESVQKPVIRDLISVYDDLAEIQRQIFGAVEAIEEGCEPTRERFQNIGTNVAHNCEFILEILARLEVTLLPFGKGKHDKQTQRVVALEAALEPGEDAEIVRTTKRGFAWRGRILRAEEVIMKKWREPAAPPASHPAPQVVVVAGES